MDWKYVLKSNRAVLLGLVVVMLGMLPVGRTIARAAKRRVLELLLPSEACVRRLIVIATRNMKTPAVATRAAPSGPIPRGESKDARVPAFGLFDPRRELEVTRKRRSTGIEPRIGFFDEWKPQKRRPVATDDDELDAASLRRRIAAMQRALDDLPGQARRLLRIIAKRKAGKILKTKPMRPGRPPGHREDGKREVDEMLASLDELARWVLVEPPPDWVVADGEPLISP